MATWSDLERELGLWQAAGETPTFWWRDDDAEAPTAALDRLLALAERHRVPLHLAVVPAEVSACLAGQLAASTDVFVLQHGFAHTNHEPPGARASEIGRHRATALQLQDLRAGWRRLTEAGFPNLLPALAPPWNRIAEETLPHLPGLGYRLLSRFDARAPQSAVPGLHQVNIHCDPIRWKGGPRFRGEEATLEILVRHLAERRQGLVDAAEPTGLSTHHLQTDEPVWDFLEHLLERLTRPGAGEWVRLSAILRDG